MENDQQNAGAGQNAPGAAPGAAPQPQQPAGEANAQIKVIITSNY